MTKFTYDRKVGELILKADGYKFGRLYDCENAWLFEADSMELEENVNNRFEGDMTISERLAIIKEEYGFYDDNCRSEAKAEAASERSFYNYIENRNPEAFDEMVRQDMMGYT